MATRAATFGLDDPWFSKCLPPVLEQEGVPGNDDDRYDPGGRTHEGIIQREYNAYRKLKGLQVRDVWSATDEEVDEIYFVQYWLPWCSQLWTGANLMYFDQRVNQGPIQATRNLQRAVNAMRDPGTTAAAMRALRLRSSALVVDGRFGIVTLEAMQSIKDRRAFLQAYLDADLRFYRALKLWWRYGRGWTRRAKEIHAAATNMLIQSEVTV